MYQDWRITRWETPIVDRPRVMMVSLSDANRELTIVFEDTQMSDRPRWRVRFRAYPAYRNIDEAYRLSLWRWLTESGQRCGATFTVLEPSPFDSWATGYLHDLEPETRHFVLATNDDVVEVLSAEEPVWEQIESAAIDEPPPGKGQHLYVGEDDEGIEQLFADLQRRNRPH